MVDVPEKKSLDYHDETGEQDHFSGREKMKKERKRREKFKVRGEVKR